MPLGSLIGGPYVWEDCLLYLDGFPLKHALQIEDWLLRFRFPCRPTDHLILVLGSVLLCETFSMGRQNSADGGEGLVSLLSHRLLLGFCTIVVTHNDC